MAINPERIASRGNVLLMSEVYRVKHILSGNCNQMCACTFNDFITKKTCVQLAQRQQQVDTDFHLNIHVFYVLNCVMRTLFEY